MKRIGPGTFPDKRCIGLIKFLCITRWNICKTMPKSSIILVKAAEFCRDCVIEKCNEHITYISMPLRRLGDIHCTSRSVVFRWFCVKLHSKKQFLILLYNDVYYLTTLILYGFIIAWSFLSQTLMIYTALLTHEDELWVVYCQFKVSSLFYFSHCRAFCPIIISMT